MFSGGWGRPPPTSVGRTPGTAKQSLHNNLHNMAVKSHFYIAGPLGYSVHVACSCLLTTPLNFHIASLKSPPSKSGNTLIREGETVCGTCTSIVFIIMMRGST